jgi:hypothetical protein
MSHTTEAPLPPAHTDEPSDWYKQQKQELEAFQASGYTDLSVLHIEDPAAAEQHPDGVLQNTAPDTDETSRPRLHRRILQSLGRTGMRRDHVKHEAASVSEEQPVITESRVEGDLTLRSYRYADREVLELTPDHVREDPSTGEPATPLMFVQGIGGGELLSKDLVHFASSGQRTALGVRMLGKRVGSNAKLVDVGLPDRVSLNYYQQSQAMLKSLVALGVKKVDLASVSEGAIPAVIARSEMITNPNLPDVGDTILVHPQGLDDRSYIARHRGGARLIRETVKMNKQNPTGRVQTEGGWSEGQTFRQINARRKGSARADVRQTLAATPPNPEAQSVTIVGGMHDPAIPAAMLKEQIIDPDHIAFIESDWGGVGHGFGPDRKVAIEQLSALLLEQERSRQLATNL